MDKIKINDDIFEIAGIEFIKVSDIDGVTTAVAKDIVFNSFFGDNNNLTESAVLKRLNEEILPKIAAAVGIENICNITTDLTTLDGLKPYDDLVSKISIPTLDFYRQNVAMFDKYKLDKYWWLATPESAKPHDNPFWTLCVSPSGNVNYYYYNFNCIGVRPFLRFLSSIFISNED